MPRAPNTKFWVSPTVLRPYAPPVCHVALDDPPPPPPEVVPSPVLHVALNDENVHAVTPARARAIRLVNALEELSLRSRAFGPAALADDVKNAPFLEPYFLPLTVTDDKTTTAVWRDNTVLEIAVDEIARAASLQLRAKCKASVVTATLARGAIGGLHVNVDTGVSYFQLPLSNDLARNGSELDTLLNGLTWEGSPYRLGIVVTDAEGRATTAWTYLHVPAPGDVDRLEALREYKVSLLKDTFGTLAGHSAAPGDDAARKKRLFPTPEELEALRVNGGQAIKVARDIDALIADKQAEYDGYVNALAKLKKPVALPESVVASSGGGMTYVDYLKVHQLKVDEYETRKALLPAQVNGSKVGLNRLKKEKADSLVAYELEDDDKRTLGKGRKAAYDLNGDNLLFVRDDKFLFATSWAIIAIIKKDVGGVFRPWRLYLSGNRDFLEAAQIDYTEARTTKSMFSSSVARTPKKLDLRVPKAPNEDLAFTEGNGEWFGFDLDPALSLTSLMTYGVSSCCAGVTFPNVDDPDTIILTHVNNIIDQPIQRAITILRAAFPGHAPYASFCTMLSAFPQAEELLKYAKAKVFPAEVAAASRLLMLPRSCHLYDMESVGFVPHSTVGFTFPVDGRRAHFTGNYGYEEGHKQFHIARGLFGKASDACSCGTEPHKGKALLADFGRDVFGPLEPLKATYATAVDLSKFRAAVQAGLNDATAQHDVIGAATTRLVKFSFENLGKGLFDTLYGEATALPELDCLLVGQKAKSVFGAK